MNWTEILSTIVSAILDAVICVGVPLLCYYLHKRNQTTEDEVVKEAVDELIDDAGQLITDIVSSLVSDKEAVDENAIATLSTSAESRNALIKQAVDTSEKMMDEDTKNALVERYNDNLDKYIKIKAKSVLYALLNAKKSD